MGGAAWYIYEHLGLAGAALIFASEGLGFPIPVEIPLLIVGLRIAHGLNTFWSIVMMVWTSSVLGNTAGYLVGYYGGRPLAMKFLAWFHIKIDFFNRVEAWFRRHGLKVVVATRWVNWGFAQNMWLCGITRFPFARFFTVMAFNDFLWAVVWTWIARGAIVAFRRGSAHFLWHSTIRVGMLAVLVLAMGLVAWLAIYLWRGRRKPARD